MTIGWDTETVARAIIPVMTAATVLPNPHASALRSARVLNKRISQLEQEQREFMHSLICAERAIRWIDEKHRPAAQERLRRLGLTEQPDSMQALVELMEAA